MGKTLAPTIAGISLFLAGLALAAAPAGSANGPVLQTVQFKGTLRLEEGVLTREPPIPFEHWKLSADGKTYYLDLQSKELLARAKKLVGLKVVVTGTLEPASPTIRVTSLKADEYVQETVNVEIRGRLADQRDWFDFEPYTKPAYPDEYFKPYPRPRHPHPGVPFITGWTITFNKKSYVLDFGDRRELLDLASKLDGRSVIVTGTRSGEVVHVTGLKADESDYAKEKVAVEIQGQLGCAWAKLGIDGDPASISPTLVRAWILVNGKSYDLVLGDNPDLIRLAAKLGGQAVMVTGTLKDGRILVTGLKAAAAA
jgi:hypothetical protein